MITSAQNSKIRKVRELLAQRQQRRDAGEFVVEGMRLCEEVLASASLPSLVLYSPDIPARGSRLADRFHAKGSDVEEISAQMMASLSDTETPQGILAVVPFPKIPEPENPSLFVIADTIRDPGNLGTLLRSAAAVGTDEFITTPGTVDPFSPKVVRSGMGAHFNMLIREMEWDEIRRKFSKGVPTHPTLFLADMHGTPLWQADLTVPLALIVGGEAEGASMEARELADAAISIPMPGKSESLNAAIAGSILLFEVLRQRQK